MPVIHVTLIEGYDQDTRARLCTRLTDAAMATIAAPAEAVTVIVNEVAPAGYMRGRTARTPGPAMVPPAELSLEFLAAQGAREIEKAMTFCAPDFRMIFPGNHSFTDIPALAAWSATRYSWVTKDIERVEEAPMGETVGVYVTGMLRGEWLDGSAFSGIRFIDRFEVRGGRITLQEVWNDLGVSR